MGQTIKLEHKVLRLTTTAGLEKTLDELSAENWEFVCIIAGHLVFNRLSRAHEKPETPLKPDPKKNGDKPKTEKTKEKPKDN